MKTEFVFVAAIAFAICRCATAETFPIIDVRYGYLIGAVEKGKWLEAAEATKSVKPGTNLPVYGVTGEVGTVGVLKVDTEQETCPGQPMVKLRPRTMKKGAIAFSGNWNALPRRSTSMVTAKMKSSFAQRITKMATRFRTKRRRIRTRS